MIGEGDDIITFFARVSLAAARFDQVSNRNLPFILPGKVYSAGSGSI